MTSVSITETKQGIAKSDVNDIIFAQGPQVLLALDIKPLDLVEKIAFEQSIHICLYRVGAGRSFAVAAFQ